MRANREQNRGRKRSTIWPAGMYGGGDEELRKLAQAREARRDREMDALDELPLEDSEVRVVSTGHR